MRFCVSLCLLFLLSMPLRAIADDDIEAQLRENRQRIEQLEVQVESLQWALESLQSQLGSAQEADRSVDPLVGTWNCSNSLFNYDMTFEAGGTLVQEEVFLGNARDGTWRRIDSSQIMLGNGNRLRPEFESDDEFTVQPIKDATIWRCVRIRD